MGLDIGYGVIKQIDKKEDIDVHYENGDFVILNNSGFIYQLGSLKQNSVYEYCGNGSFRAGSYSGYNSFRKELLALVSSENIEDYWKNNSTFIEYRYIDMNREKKLNNILENGNSKIKITPFLELIYFSDCEGLIGPEICEKLYKDFIKYNDVAKEKLSEWHYELYCEFMKSTSITGCVLHFH